MNVPYLGRIPLDPKMVECSDAGKAYLDKNPDSETSKAFNDIVEQIMENKQAAVPETKPGLKQQDNIQEGSAMKIAIPIAEGKLTAHFGHAAEFAIIHVENQEVKDKELLVPPPHEPGVLPKWLGELGVDVIIAGGMGSRAQGLFGENGIKVLTGAPSLTPEELVEQYLANSLVTGENVCDH
jgi:predicted Fe-Mo cluster-binding NifX family protein